MSPSSVLPPPDTWVDFRFARGVGLTSRAIELFSAGPYSHVDAIESSGRWYGARSDECAGIPPGVESRQPGYIGSTPGDIFRLPMTAEQKADFWIALYSQRHRPYDKIAILGFAAGRNWREDDSWFCSELITWGLEQAKIIVTLDQKVSKVTPTMLTVIIQMAGGARLSSLPT